MFKWFWTIFSLGAPGLWYKCKSFYTSFSSSCIASVLDWDLLVRGNVFHAFCRWIECLFHCKWWRCFSLLLPKSNEVFVNQHEIRDPGDCRSRKGNTAAHKAYRPWWHLIGSLSVSLQSRTQSLQGFWSAGQRGRKSGRCPADQKAWRLYGTRLRSVWLIMRRQNSFDYELTVCSFDTRARENW